jgi:hypothetical protein
MMLLTKPINDHTDEELMRAGLAFADLHARSGDARYGALVERIDAELIKRMKASNPYEQVSHGTPGREERAA